MGFVEPADLLKDMPQDLFMELYQPHFQDPDSKKIISVLSGSSILLEQSVITTLGLQALEYLRERSSMSRLENPVTVKWSSDKTVLFDL